MQNFSYKVQNIFQTKWTCWKSFIRNATLKFICVLDLEIGLREMENAIGNRFPDENLGIYMATKFYTGISF